MAESKSPEPAASRATQALADNGAVLSRRQALTAAGALATAGVASAQSMTAEPAGASIGIALRPANSVEFRARFFQSGTTGDKFTALGYLTRVAGLTDDHLMEGTPLSERTALFTAYAEGDLLPGNRVHDLSGVHTLDIDGRLTVYQRQAPGASFDDVESFRSGTPVAQFDVTLHDILTVIAPGKGLPSLNGSMRQTQSDKVAGTTAGRRFGRIGSRARLTATGLGTLVDPARLNSVLDMGGNWVVE